MRLTCPRCGGPLTVLPEAGGWTLVRCLHCAALPLPAGPASVTCPELAAEIARAITPDPVRPAAIREAY